jgi:hypothetical protein
VLLTPVRPAALATLAAVFVTMPLLQRFWPRSPPAFAPLAVALLAGALVAGSLALQAADGAGAGAVQGGGADDAYYGK